MGLFFRTSSTSATDATPRKGWAAAQIIKICKRMVSGTVRNWAYRHHDSLPTFSTLLSSLPHLPLSTRKVILTWTRVQQPLTETSLLYQKERQLLRERHFVPSNPYDRTPSINLSIEQLLQSLGSSVTDPVTQGWISTMVRMIPYEDYSEVHEEWDKRIEVEIKAAITTSHHACYNYDAILKRECANRERVHPNLPRNPEIQRAIYDHLSYTKDLLRNRLFYPRTSKKTIGVAAQEICRISTSYPIQGIVREREICSLEDVEREYHEEGLVVEGPAELRVAWKYNDLKPRVYYAQGPTAYKASKYIQEIFNILVDSLPMTHRLDRFEPPSDLRLTTNWRFTIYDYTSFTSSLDEVKCFLNGLAEYFSDTEIWVVDTWEGIIQHNLGEMISAYVTICSDHAEFDVTKVLSPELAGGYLMYRHTCGMLGVPGNISSATLLHGVNLALITESLRLSRVVGDDAQAGIIRGMRAYEWEVFQNQVRNLGEVAITKFEKWDYVGEDEEDYEATGWHYVKRPINRIGNKITRGLLFIWPSIASILDLKDNIHTEVHGSLSLRRRRFLTQWRRLLSKIFVSQVHLTPVARQLLFIFQTFAYDHLGFILGGGRSLHGFVHLQGENLIVPIQMKVEDFGKDWAVLTAAANRQPRVIAIPHAGPAETWFGYQGEEFESPRSKLLGLAEKLGYVEKHLVYDEVEIDNFTDPALIVELLKQEYSFCYSYRVVRDFPDLFFALRSFHASGPP